MRRIRSSYCWTIHQKVNWLYGESTARWRRHGGTVWRRKSPGNLNLHRGAPHPRKMRSLARRNGKNWKRTRIKIFVREILVCLSFLLHTKRDVTKTYHHPPRRELMAIFPHHLMWDLTTCLLKSEHSDPENLRLGTWKAFEEQRHTRYFVAWWARVVLKNMCQCLLGTHTSLSFSRMQCKKLKLVLNQEGL